MIKKICGISFKLFLVFAILIALVEDCSSVNASEATTLRDLMGELEKLEAEKEESDDNTSSTESEIAANNAEIAAAYAKIEQAKDDIEEAEIKIEESNTEIAELSVIAAELMVMYQELQNQDTYMEFVTASSTLTELIMKIDAISLLMEYNETTIVTLENLIVANEAEQLELIKLQEELNDNIDDYKTKIESLEDDLQYFAEITEDIDDQIKNQEALIEYYEDLGCELDQNLDDCVEIANNVSWLKPLTYGIVTSEFGYRTIWGEYSFHNGIDIGGNAEGTNVYAAADGTVAAITVKSSCGGNKVYIHSYVNGEAYTQSFLHLLTINVSVGDKVTTDTVIGTVGGGSQTYWDSCSTGAHLHFGVATGFYLGGGSDSYSSYYTYVANSIEPPGFPSYYKAFYSRTDWYD